MSGSVIDQQQNVMSATLASYPMNRFTLDYIRGEGRAREFLGFRELAELRPAGIARGTDELARALIESNRAWGNDVLAAVERWRDGSSVALVAGQQVGFAGGPLYTLAKIATLLSIRNTLRQRGVASSVFFWLASEDHDFDEVATVHLSTKAGLQRVRSDERPAKSAPVGPMPVPASLRRRLLEQLPAAAADGWAAEGLSFTESFARLLVATFGGEEIVLVDSLLPQLRRAGKRLLHEVVGQYDAIERHLNVRAAALRDAGYSPQVVPDEEGRYSLLFIIDEESGERLHLRRDGEAFRVGSQSVTTDELHAMVDAAPERISTGALTRPLLQDDVLAPELFVGGPAELAYYAQLAPVADAAGVRQASVALRGHALVLPQRSFDALSRYGIDAPRIFTEPATLLLEHEPQAAAALEQELRSMRDDIERHVGEVERIVTPADRGMKKSIDRSLAHLRYHLDRLGERSRRAIARRDRERYDAVVGALALVAPEGIPQDRKAAWITYWLKHGREVVDRLIDEIEPHSDNWKIIALK